MPELGLRGDVQPARALPRACEAPEVKVVLPRHLNDTEAVELIHGPPRRMLRSEDMRGYQRWMSQKIIELDAVFLAAEMGLGKTGAALNAVARLLSARVVKQVLIVAPLLVAEETWPTEIAVWAFSRKLTYRVVTGNLEERRAALKRDAQITIVNRENLVWLKGELGVIRWRFDMIVYDEASRLKSGRKKTQPTQRKDGSMSVKRTTELGVIQSIRHRTAKIVLLSGTPAPQGLIDLWGPMYALDKGLRLGSSMTKFKQRWFSPPNPYTHRVEPFPHSEGEIMDRISDIFFSLRKEDYLDLPPLMPVDHYVSLEPADLARYNRFERDMGIEVTNRAGEKEVILAVNNGVLTGKLLQFANGSLYLGDKFDEETGGKLPRESVPIHTKKLDVLGSIIQEAAGNPVLVAYSFQFDREAIAKRFPQARFYGETKDDMRDWNAGRVPLMVTHPASAGHGLNFQYGGHIAVWYGLTWSLELYQQFRDRLHRQGQEKTVFLHRIMARGTADEDILPTLDAKGATQDRITDTVRVRLKRAAA